MNAWLKFYVLCMKKSRVASLLFFTLADAKAYAASDIFNISSIDTP